MAYNVEDINYNETLDSPFTFFHKVSNDFANFHIVFNTPRCLINGRGQNKWGGGLEIFVKFNNEGGSK